MSHLANLTVAGRAGQAELNVRVVREAGVIRQEMAAGPVQRLLIGPSLAHLGELPGQLRSRSSLGDHLMAEQALLDVGIPGRHALIGRAMTKRAL